jgi:allophanate hydrolase
MDMTLSTLLDAYREGRATPREIVGRVLETIRAEDPLNVWISVVSDQWLSPHLERLERTDPATLPLYGIPFAIKDNIDLAGIGTTAGCPAYRYVPDAHAAAVSRLITAGALPLGKTNLDQFATGLVGTRSPYGACRNPLNPDYIAGGSSAGSAVAVSLGQVSFALGTDTAGSGRVPAAFTNIVGLKATRGLIPASGVVPACRSLDCVSVLAATAADALAVLDAAAGPDVRDPYSRPAGVPPLGHGFIPTVGFRFGRPPDAQLELFGDEHARLLYQQALSRLRELGGVEVEIDLAPFLETARLLYEGPWVAERYEAVGAFIDAHPQDVLPVTRAIIAGGAGHSAAAAFAAQHRLKALERAAAAAWEEVDFVVTPTAGTVYRIEEVERDPVALNSRLGHYTNFMNLLDLCAVAVPAGLLPHGPGFGVTLFAPAFQDRDLAAVADRLHRAAGLPAGATGRPLPEQPPVEPAHEHVVRLAVCGAHMSGLPLNGELLARRARQVATTRTAPGYRLYALPGGPPKRPGLAYAGGDETVEVEVWSMPVDQLGSLMASVPSPLCIGRVRLVDGSEVSGFLCEEHAAMAAEDITRFGSWRRWVASPEGGDSR